MPITYHHPSSKAGRKLIAAAVRAADAELFDRWFGAPGLTEADAASLTGLLRRGLPFCKWSDDDGGERRGVFLDRVVQKVTDRFGEPAATDIRAVADLFTRVERGYRELRTVYAGTPARAMPPVERITAVVVRAALAAEELGHALRGAATGKAFDLFGVAVPDPAGRPMQPDVPLDVIIRQTTHALKAEGHEQSWFGDDGRLVLPATAQAGVEAVKAIEDVVLNASAFRQWEWIEEECRYFGGRLEPLPSGGDARWRHRPADLPLLALDLAANERLHKSLLQNRVPFERFPEWNGNSVELLPRGNLGPTELHSYAALESLLHLSPEREEADHCGLTLPQWLRGYSALQALVAREQRRDRGAAGLVPLVERRALAGHLRRVGLRGDAAERFLRLAAFATDSRDLFDTPVVEVADGKVLLFGPALLGAIPAQTTLSRLGSLGDHLDEKGKAFEKSTLDFLRGRGFEARAVKRTFGSEKAYDYDVLLKWEDRIFLFECKCRALSANSLASAAMFWKEVEKAAGQVRRLLDGLAAHPELLDEAFGPGSSALRVVPCVLNALPFASVEPIAGVHFLDDSSFRRFFESAAYNLVSSTAKGETRSRPFPTRRLWAGASPTADDLERLVRSPPQLELALRQIHEVEVETRLSPALVVEGTRLTWRPVSLLASAAMMLELGREASARDPAEHG